MSTPVPPPATPPAAEGAEPKAEDGGHGGHDAAAPSHKSRYVSDHSISMADVLKFLFPPGLQHPGTATRLFLLGDLGPVYSEHSYVNCVCPECKKVLRGRMDKDRTCV
jgi:hypothetical protein